MKVIKMFLITAMVFTILIATNSLLAAEEKLVPPEDFTYFVARDGIKIYYQELKAEGTTKGTVVFLQGINGGAVGPL